MERAYLLISTLLLFILLSGKSLAQPLIEAVRKNDVSTIESLLSSGTNVNEKNNFGATALMFAAVNGHIDSVRLLIEKGADANVAKGGLEALAVKYPENAQYYKEGIKMLR